MKDKIDITRNNICTLKVDGILCQANTELEIEDATTQRLMQKGGDKIHMECNEFDNLEKGNAVITSAGTLPARHLVHTIINDMGETTEEDILLTAIRNALLIAKDKNLRTIAIPMIGESAGIPIRRAAELILTEVKKHFDSETSLEKIILVAEDNCSYNSFEEAARQL